MTRGWGWGNSERASIAPCRRKQGVRRDDPARSKRGPPQEFTSGDVAALLLVGRRTLGLLPVTCHNMQLKSKRTAFQYNIRRRSANVPNKGLGRGMPHLYMYTHLFIGPGE
jgi:hypothetical protein